MQQYRHGSYSTQWLLVPCAHARQPGVQVTREAGAGGPAPAQLQQAPHTTRLHCCRPCLMRLRRTWQVCMCLTGSSCTTETEICATGCSPGRHMLTDGPSHQVTLVDKQQHVLVPRILLDVLLQVATPGAQGVPRIQHLPPPHQHCSAWRIRVPHIYLNVQHCLFRKVFIMHDLTCVDCKPDQKC